MIYVGEQGNVIYISEGIEQSILDTMVAVEQLPQPEFKTGFTSVLKANKSTSSVFYEYIKNPEVDELKLALNDAISLLNELGGL